MKNLDLHVGYDRNAVKDRVLKAIQRAENGQQVGESHVTFESWEGLTKVLTTKRLELLRHLHAHPATSIAELARALGRDYKRVHEDIGILSAAGLVERTDEGILRAGFDEIRTSIAFILPAA
jgi:predicted transcriptional regulator